MMIVGQEDEAAGAPIIGDDDSDTAGDVTLAVMPTPAASGALNGQGRPSEAPSANGGGRRATVATNEVTRQRQTEERARQAQSAATISAPMAGNVPAMRQGFTKGAAGRMSAVQEEEDDNEECAGWGGIDGQQTSTSLACTPSEDVGPPLSRHPLMVIQGGQTDPTTAMGKGGQSTWPLHASSSPSDCSRRATVTTASRGSAPQQSAHRATTGSASTSEHSPAAMPSFKTMMRPDVEEEAPPTALDASDGAAAVPLGGERRASSEGQFSGPTQTSSSRSDGSRRATVATVGATRQRQSTATISRGARRSTTTATAIPDYASLRHTFTSTSPMMSVATDGEAEFPFVTDDACNTGDVVAAEAQSAATAVSASTGFIGSQGQELQAQRRDGSRLATTGVTRQMQSMSMARGHRATTTATTSEPPSLVMETAVLAEAEEEEEEDEGMGEVWDGSSQGSIDEQCIRTSSLTVPCDAGSPQLSRQSMATTLPEPEMTIGRTSLTATTAQRSSSTNDAGRRATATTATGQRQSTMIPRGAHRSTTTATASMYPSVQREAFMTDTAARLRMADADAEDLAVADDAAAGKEESEVYVMGNDICADGAPLDTVAVHNRDGRASRNGQCLLQASPGSNRGLRPGVSAPPQRPGQSTTAAWASSATPPGSPHIAASRLPTNPAAVRSFEELILPNSPPSQLTDQIRQGSLPSEWATTTAAAAAAAAAAATAAWNLSMAQGGRAGEGGQQPSHGFDAYRSCLPLGGASWQCPPPPALRSRTLFGGGLHSSSSSKLPAG